MKRAANGQIKKMTHFTLFLSGKDKDNHHAVNAYHWCCAGTILTGLQAVSNVILQAE